MSIANQVSAICKNVNHLRSIQLLATSEGKLLISSVMSKLYWLSVRERVDFKILLSTFKPQHGLAPYYLSELL